MLPLVVIVQRPDGQTRRYAFADSPVRIGRSPLNDLQLSDGFVSRWEGVLRFNEQQISYFNVGTTNPTFVNGRACGPSEEIELDAGTELTIGEIKLRFAREPVPEQDLRRKGKRRPESAGETVEAKTVWLGADQVAEVARRMEAARAGTVPQSSFSAGRDAGPSTPSSSATGTGSATRGQQDKPVGRPSQSSEPPTRIFEREDLAGPLRDKWPTPPPTPSASTPAGAVRTTSLRVIGGVPSPSSVGVPSPASGDAAPSTSSGGEQGSTRSERSVDAHSYGLRTGNSTTGGSPSASVNDPELERLHAKYRETWQTFFDVLTQRLESASDAERPDLARNLQRWFPQTVREQDFRSLLRRWGLAPRRSDVPELAEWLQTITQGVLPPNVRIETGQTLERILSLLELLAQSFAEIGDAQDSVSRRWLGRSPRSSLLRSDNARVILTYLLNPRSDWNQRLGEFEENLRDLITHEWALFKATLEGSKALLESLSPAALAEQEGVALEDDEEGSSAKPRFWNKLMPRDASDEERLWRRFVSTYQGLMEGDRYQRAFVGRQFARTYLNAMGRDESSK